MVLVLYFLYLYCKTQRLDISLKTKYLIRDLWVYWSLQSQRDNSGSYWVGNLDYTQNIYTCTQFLYRQTYSRQNKIGAPKMQNNHGAIKLLSFPILR